MVLDEPWRWFSAIGLKSEPFVMSADHRLRAGPFSCESEDESLLLRPSGHTNVVEDEDGRTQTASRDIAAGDELTIDHPCTADRWPDEPCRCVIFMPEPGRLDEAAASMEKSLWGLR